MSPAKKRKTAPRAASQPAKAPAQSRKPAVAKPAGRKLAGRAATDARAAAASAGERCTLSPRRLAGLLDGAERAELLAHVPACGPCSTTLTVLAAESQGLQRLALGSAGGTAVERILARGIRQGDRKLADLVYELAKACLVVVQDIDRRLHLATRPREAAVIERDVRGVAARLPARLREAASALPRGKPEESQALNAAESCVRILERIEGASERQRLAKSVWLICAGRAAEAEGVLREGLVAGAFGHNRIHAHHNLLWALVRQDKFNDVVEWGQLALGEKPTDWLSLYNVVAASARCGRRASFSNFAKKLASLDRRTRGFAQLEGPLLDYEIRRMAEDLEISEKSVMQALGLAHANEKVRHARN